MYAKLLFTAIAGLSLLFATGCGDSSTNSDSFASTDGDCVRGVYSGNSRFVWIRTPGSSSDYEIEVNYDQNVVIFLVTQQNEGADNGTQLCTSYSFPNFQTSGPNDDGQTSIDVSSADIKNTGIIEDTSALYGNIRVAKDAEGNCSTVRAKASRDWSFDPTLVAQRIDKTPRSFDQIRGVCNALAEAEAEVEETDDSEEEEDENEVSSLIGDDNRTV